MTSARPKMKKNPDVIKNSSILNANPFTNEIDKFWEGKMKNTLDDRSRTFLNKINKSFPG